MKLEQSFFLLILTISFNVRNALKNRRVSETNDYNAYQFKLILLRRENALLQAL